MARTKLAGLKETAGAGRERYGELVSRNAVTNMKKRLLNSAATYDTCMGWCTPWQRLVEVVGEKDATLYARTISTANSCQPCPLFFISGVKGLGLDPADLNYGEREEVLTKLGRSIVKDPTTVSDELFEKLRIFFGNKEIVVTVGFVGQMIATSNFNSVLQIDVDKRLLPIIDKLKLATWRDNLKE